ncbi:MAG TPA: purine-binding chemotaxis protein CheW [Planctomycetes bacterium]|nr:purine-binding chemotaxis protein CheW [Planctomycetota bacterium]
MPESASGTASVQHLAGKYLTFRLGCEEYGLPILAVREIITMLDITPVPGSQRHVRGVINLRGKIIPVSDLRVELGMQAATESSDTCIIVVDLIREDSVAEIGILVDAVSEVLDIQPEELEPPPVFGGDIDTRALTAIARCNGEVKLLLHIERALKLSMDDGSTENDRID